MIRKGSAGLDANVITFRSRIMSSTSTTQVQVQAQVQATTQADAPVARASLSNLRAIALAAREQKAPSDEEVQQQKADLDRKIRLVSEAADYLVQTTRVVAEAAANRGHGYTRINTPGEPTNLVFRLPGTVKEKSSDGEEFLVQLNPEAQVYWSGAKGDPRENGLPWVGILQGFLDKQGKPNPASVPGGRTAVAIANKTLESDGVRINVAFNGKDRGLILTAIWEEETWAKREEAIRRKFEERPQQRPRQDREERQDRQDRPRQQRPREDRPQRPREEQGQRLRLGDFIRN